MFNAYIRFIRKAMERWARGDCEGFLRAAMACTIAERHYPQFAETGNGRFFHQWLMTGDYGTEPDRVIPIE